MKTLTLSTLALDGRPVPFLTVTPALEPQLGPIIALILEDLRRDRVIVHLEEKEIDSPQLST